MVRVQVPDTQRASTVNREKFRNLGDALTEGEWHVASTTTSGGYVAPEAIATVVTNGRRS